MSTVKGSGIVAEKGILPALEMRLRAGILFLDLRGSKLGSERADTEYVCMHDERSEVVFRIADGGLTSHHAVIMIGKASGVVSITSWNLRDLPSNID
jgi:hypothetical protein